MAGYDTTHFIPVLKVINYLQVATFKNIQYWVLFGCLYVEVIQGQILLQIIANVSRYNNNDK